MGQMFILNAPLLFTGVWAVVKGFLDQRTRDKIKIYGHKYQKDLLALVDADNLPDFLGGNCTCPEFGGCIFSNAGPWNDYEIVHPTGIRRKQIMTDSEENGNGVVGEIQKDELEKKEEKEHEQEKEEEQKELAQE